MTGRLHPLAAVLLSAALLSAALAGCTAGAATVDGGSDAAATTDAGTGDGGGDGPRDAAAGDAAHDGGVGDGPTGGDACQPACAGKCPGAADGCGGVCASNGCTDGCCTAAGECLAYASQTSSTCGREGDACASCTLLGRTCDATLHTCMSTRANDAAFVAQVVPGVMTPGQSTTVSVTMRNIGTTTWTAATAYKLGAQNPQDNSTWGPGRVELGAGDSVAPGQAHTFTFTATAPATAGIRNFQWRMLREMVEWFGDYSTYRPVVVGGGAATVCEAMRALAGTNTDAAPALRACLAAAAAGTIVELPAGIYRLDGKIEVTTALTLRTEGKGPTAARCAAVGHDCAELAASTAFADPGGLLQLLAAGSVVDHLVVNGNKAARAGSTAGTQCSAGSNSYGYNVRIVCSGCALTNSVTKNALCGTGCEVSGTGANVLLWRNAVVDNGVHDTQNLWSDGVTVHDYADSTFVANEFRDNTDVDFIFGGCQRCMIQGNAVTHTAAFAGGSFAALMLHAWPSGATSGNFLGSDTSGNTIDCGPSKRCGIGLYLGPDAWYDADTYGGAVHHNVVTNAQQGVLIDDVHDMQVWNNHVSSPATTTVASCGTRSTTAYAKGTTSANVDTSADTMGTVYTAANWDGCIPNWWH
jgi:hypothetical protein